MAVGVAIMILALPALRGIEYFFPVIKPPTGEAAVVVRLAAPSEPRLAAVEPLDQSDPRGFFDPTIPAKMLFSDHRGLFIWTPLTAAAALGFGLALARARKTLEHYSFLATLLAASLALLCIHVFWPRWDGGFAFSQRFLTALFPVFLIGVAELVRRWGYGIFPALVAAAAFAVSIALVRDVGYDGISERDNLSRVVEAGWDNRYNMRLDVQNDAKARWVYLWGLLHGRDASCIDDPPGTTEC